MISVYYLYDFEAHKNLSHKQFPILVYYFIDYAVNPRINSRPQINFLFEKTVKMKLKLKKTSVGHSATAFRNLTIRQLSIPQ